MNFFKYLLCNATKSADIITTTKHQKLTKNEKRKVKNEKNNAIWKNFFELILREGIGLSGWAIVSMSASVISFQIKAAKYPEYNDSIVNIIIIKMLVVYGWIPYASIGTLAYINM